MRTPFRHIVRLVLGVAALFVVAVPAAQGASRGIWLSQAQVSGLPTAGSGWLAVKSAADALLGAANVADQNSTHDVSTLAVALVYARTGDVAYRKKAADAIMSAIGTEAGGRTLALSRNLAGYAIAADLIDLAGYDALKDSRFRSWLGSVRFATLDGLTLVQTQEKRANNWGTSAGAARIAADAYLGDVADLVRAASVFRGWLGDRSAYVGFDFGGDLSWQADPKNPVGINKKGALIQSKNVDGVLPDDQRRSGGFVWPPPQENYVWGALGSALVEAELLKHAGYTDVYQWSDSALKRALDWLHTIDQFPAQADDGYAPWIANAAYGTSYPAPARTNGKAIGWTSWTHAKSGTTTTTTTSGTTTTTSGTTTATSGTTTTTSGTTTTTTTTTSPLTGGAKTTSFAASADAQVNSAKPTNNYGALTTLRAKTSSTSDGAVYRSYLTFTVTGLSGPPSAVKLRLYVTDASDNGGLIYPVANAWNESTISWANAPQLPATSIGQATAQTAETWTEIDLTSLITTNGTYSIALASPSDNSVYYASRESANPPQLIVIS